MGYIRKIPLDLNCGIGIAREVILSKWKYCILTQIEKGVCRPTELQEAIPDLTKRVLLQQLKELEYYGIVEKHIFAEVPFRAEYSLTPLAKEEVLPLLKMVNAWGMKFRPRYESLIDLIND